MRLLNRLVVFFLLMMSPYLSGAQAVNCVQLDGVDDLVEIPPIAFLTDDYAWSSWLYWNGNPTTARIFEFGRDDRNFGMNVQGPSGNIQFSIDSSNGAFQVFATSYLMPVNRWVHLGFTSKGDTLRFYVDGIQQNQFLNFAADPSDYIGALPEHCYVGGTSLTGYAFFNGFVDEMTLWDWPFNPQYWRTKMCTKQTNDLLANSLRAYWSFDASAGTVAANSSIQGTGLNANVITGTSLPLWSESRAPVGDTSMVFLTPFMPPQPNFEYAPSSGDTITMLPSPFSNADIHYYLIKSSPQSQVGLLPSDIPNTAFVGVYGNADLGIHNYTLIQNYKAAALAPLFLLGFQPRFYYRSFQQGSNWTNVLNVYNSTQFLPDSIFQAEATDLSGELLMVATIGAQCPVLASFTAPSTFCKTDTLKFVNTSLNASNFQWAVDGQAVAGNQPDTLVLAPPHNISTIRLIANDGSCADTAFVQINYGTTAVLDLGVDTTICGVNSYTITPGSYQSYLWNDGSSGTTLIVSASGQYSLTVSSAATDCPASDTVSILFDTLPSLLVNGLQPFCSNATISLSASGADNFSWSPANLFTQPTLSTTVVSANSSTSIFLRGTNASGCFSIDTFQLNVLPAPQLNGGGDLAICPGQDSLQFNASSNAPVLWSPAQFLSGSNTLNPKVLPPPATKTDYVITAQAPNGCAATDTVSITSFAKIPVNAGLDREICIGANTVLGGSPAAPANISDFRWSSGSLLNDSLISNPIFSGATSQVFVFTVSNDTCTGTDTVQVLVNPLPQIAISGPDTVCAAASFSLNATAGLRYAWSGLGVSTNDSLNSLQIVAPATTQLLTYQLQVSDSNGCSNLANKSIFVKPSATIDLASADSLCSGDSLHIIITTPLTNISWTPMQFVTGFTTASPTFHPTSTTTFRVSALDTGGCQLQDSIQIVVFDLPAVNAGADRTICQGDTASLLPAYSNTTSVLWTPQLFISNFTALNPVVYPDVSQQYLVEAFNAIGCVASDTLLITVNGNPQLNLPQNAGICSGDTLALNVLGALTYDWNPKVNITGASSSNPLLFPAVDTWYTVLATDVNGCAILDSILVSIETKPVANAGDGSTSCGQQGTVLGGLPVANAAYRWSPGSLLNDSTVLFPVLVVDLDTTVRFVLTVSNNGCLFHDSVTITPLRLSAPLSDTTFCAGNSISLSPIALNGDTADLTVRWSPSPIFSNPSALVTTMRPTVSTRVKLELVNRLGCTYTDEFELNVLPAPTLSFLLNTHVNCEEVEATVTNNSENAANFRWLLNGVQITTDFEPTFKLAFDEPVTLDLIATHSTGTCQDTSTQSFEIGDFREELDFNLPNVITPNGDGMNDFLEVDLEQYLLPCARLVVFNRWGNLIFDSDGKFPSWDGRDFSGNRVVEGTYFYTLEVNGVLYKSWVFVAGY